MTIRRGESWGMAGPYDPDTPVAQSDRDVNRLLRQGASIVYLAGGDIACALGVPTRTAGEYARVTTFVIDAYNLNWTSIDGSVNEMSCYSSCIHGSWWHGDSWWFSAGGFVDGREVLPRSHPNDGIAEVLHVDRSMSLRQRCDARRRLRWGTHLPHPALNIVRGTTLTWGTGRAKSLVVDGTKVGDAVNVTISVVPDAYRVCVAAGVE